MSPAGRALRALDAWFFTPVAAHSLAVTRVVLGLTMLSCYLLYASSLEWVYGADGLARYLMDIDPPYTVTQRHLWPLWGLLIVSAASFAVGLFTRPAGLCLALCHHLFVRFDAVRTWGWAETVPLLIVYVALSGAGRCMSVDAWRSARQGRPLTPEAPAWALRLLQFHVAMVYVSAAWHRIDDDAWLRGEMVYEAVANSWYTRLPYLDLQPWKPLLRLATWATELAELSAPLALWVPRLRHTWVAALMLLHAGLHLGASVGCWQPMMLAGLMSFVDPAWTRAALGRLTGLRPEPNPKE